MRVLHIISSSGMYGAEAVILNLSRNLRERGHQSLLCVFSNSKNPNLQLHQYAQAEGIPSHVIPCSGQVDRSAVTAIRQLTTETGADLIHSHNFKADVYAWLALRNGAIPLVATCHTWYDTDRIVTLYGKIDRFILRRFARVVAVSEDVRQRLLQSGVHPDAIRYVRNGIDLRPFANASPSLAKSPGAPLVGFIGRLAWEKGADVFLRAAASVSSQSPDTRFVLVGEGPDRAALERSIADLGLDGRVTMLGRREDMPSVYASLDAMVSASRQEGLPIAILEGMASGLPLVATTVGEVPTVVVDGRTGILVPPEDPARLADAMIQLLRDPARRTQMGAAGRQLIRDKFSADTMTSAYLEVYEEALATRPAAREGRS